MQVSDGSRDSSRGHANGSVGHLFADTGGANLRLLHRVTEVFSPGVVSLLASAQVRHVVLVVSCATVTARLCVSLQLRACI